MGRKKDWQEGDKKEKPKAKTLCVWLHTPKHDCQACEQNTHDYDKHFPPEVAEFLRWIKTMPIPGDKKGRLKPYGPFCYECGECAKRHCSKTQPKRLLEIFKNCLERRGPEPSTRAREAPLATAFAKVRPRGRGPGPGPGARGLEPGPAARGRGLGPGAQGPQGHGAQGLGGPGPRS